MFGSSSTITKARRREAKQVEVRDDDSSVSHLLQADERELVKEGNKVSFLTPDAVRWMNARRPNAAHGKKEHISASRIIQLRSIFKGLDFDSSGELSLVELKEAVRFVASLDKSSTEPPLFEDPQKMSQFFDAMDTDGSGTVDFQEFLLAMTSQGGGNGKNNERLQQAFFEFANKHRRQKLLETLSDSSLSDLQRLEEGRKLFAINFFKEEGQSAHTVEDQIKKIIRDAKKERRELHADSWKERQKELVRCRKAAIYFKSLHQAKFSDPKFKQSFSTILLSDIHDEFEKDHKLHTANLELSQKMKKFPLTDNGTIVINPNPSKLVKLDALLFKQRCFEKPAKAHVMSHLHPPQSLRQKAIDEMRNKEA